MPSANLTTIQTFCASHRLHNPNLSHQENILHFGKCNHINSHGHNYRIEATVVGEINPTLGFAMNLFQLDQLLSKVLEPLDHKRLDMDIEFFQKSNVVATAENLAIYIWSEMVTLLPKSVKLYNIRVQETEKYFIDYKGT